MDIKGKVWGTTSPLFNKNNVEVHRITAKKGGFCSLHAHNHKYNAFYIESGKMKISVYKNDYALCDETIISSGQMTTVAPEEYHQFEALEDTVAYEIYWVELSESDIIRKNVGGSNK